MTEYREYRQRFAVTGDLARQSLAWAQPLAMEALGIHTQRQTLVEGELPAYVVLTTPETNGGWGELMPVWFKPYERPVPFYCLDNWALFALMYQSAWGAAAPPPLFTVQNLARVILGADLLIPFLPSTAGAGRFLRHGALAVLLGVLWLEPEARGAWLAWHAAGARRLVAHTDWRTEMDVGARLERMEEEAFLIPERQRVAGETAVIEFLGDEERREMYGRLFGGLCLSVTALVAALGPEWRKWIFQAVNVKYQLADFGVAEIESWLQTQP